VVHALYDGAVAGENAGRWVVGLVVAVLVALLGGYATLAASDRISCPFCKSPGGSGATPTPVSTVDGSAGLALQPASGPAGTSVAVTLSGFGAREPVAVKLSTDLIASFTADASGSVHDTGENNEGEMTALAQLTGGRAFDARTGSLSDAFKEIRGYQ
jgi:hypothetical protein